MKRTARPEILTAPQWRAAVKQGKAPGLARFSPIVRASDGGVSFVASSAAPDRYGDTIDQTGWDTASYERNPVLLWAHDYSTPPVGKVGALDKSGDLTARGIEFTPEAMHPFGAQVGEMVKAGFLNTVSVGFLPKRWEERRDEDGAFLGYNFKEAELLEISVVPVPANPQALAEGRAFTKALGEWARAAPDDAPALARGFRDELRAHLDAVMKAADRAAEAGDTDAFADMLALLQRIATATEAQARDLAEVRALLGASGAGLVRAPDLTDADSRPTSLAAALGALFPRR